MEEQRSQPGAPTARTVRRGVERGCIAGRMQLEFHHGLPAPTINAELAEPAETRGVRLQADFFQSGCRLRTSRYGVPRRSEGGKPDPTLFCAFCGFCVECRAVWLRQSAGRFTLQIRSLCLSAEASRSGGLAAREKRPGGIASPA